MINYGIEYQIFINRIQEQFAMQSQKPQVESMIPVRDMYNNKNRNYPWEQFKYVIPKHYISGQINAGLEPKPSPKTTYIDHYQQLKSFVPSPDAYNIVEQNRPLSGKMGKDPRKTIAETIIDKERRAKSPGPATYFLRPKTATSTLGKNPPEFKDHYLNEVEFLAAEAPGVGQYNLEAFQNKNVHTPKFLIPNNKSRTRTSQQSSSASNLKKKQLSKTVIVGTFDWIAQQKKEKNRFFFGKMSRFTKQNKYEIKPSPNQYCLNNKWTDSNNILKTSSSLSNLKNVYYS